MGKLEIRQVIAHDGAKVRWACWHCPGCDEPHGVPIEGTNSIGAGPWGISEDGATLSPSILVHPWTATEPGYKSQPLCHSFIRGNRIEFLGDCTHALAGQTVDIPLEPESPGAP